VCATERVLGYIFKQNLCSVNLTLLRKYCRVQHLCVKICHSILSVISFTSPLIRDTDPSLVIALLYSLCIHKIADPSEVLHALSLILCLACLCVFSWNFLKIGHVSAPAARNWMFDIGQWSLKTIRYDTRCCFNVRSKANISQLNLPHGTDN